MHEGHLLQFPSVDAAYEFYQGTTAAQSEPVEM
jgi:hypothetical protein